MMRQMTFEAGPTRLNPRLITVRLRHKKHYVRDRRGSVERYFDSDSVCPPYQLLAYSSQGGRLLGLGVLEVSALNGGL